MSKEIDDLGCDCPGCDAALTVDNAGGYRRYCQMCVDVMPELPTATNNNGHRLIGSYPNFKWVAVSSTF